MEDTEKEVSWFTKILLMVFSGLLFSMIVFNYFYIDPKGDINVGLVTLLLILLVLILSETFDQFSIGKLISISREVKKKEKQVQELEKKNATLFNQLMNISNSQGQSQQHINVSGDLNTTMPTMDENMIANSTPTGFMPNPSKISKVEDEK